MGRNLGSLDEITMAEMKPNKGVQAIVAKARLSLTPDVGIRIYGLPHVKWTLHHPPAKSIDRAATISDRSRA